MADDNKIHFDMETHGGEFYNFASGLSQIPYDYRYFMDRFEQTAIYKKRFIYYFISSLIFGAAIHGGVIKNLTKDWYKKILLVFYRFLDYESVNVTDFPTLDDLSDELREYEEKNGYKEMKVIKRIQYNYMKYLRKNLSDIRREKEIHHTPFRAGLFYYLPDDLIISVKEYLEHPGEEESYSKLLNSPNFRFSGSPRPRRKSRRGFKRSR